MYLVSERRIWLFKDKVEVRLEDEMLSSHERLKDNGRLSDLNP